MGPTVFSRPKARHGQHGTAKASATTATRPRRGVAFESLIGGRRPHESRPVTEGGTRRSPNVPLSPVFITVVGRKTVPVVAGRTVTLSPVASPTVSASPAKTVESLAGGFTGETCRSVVATATPSSTLGRAVTVGGSADGTTTPPDVGGGTAFAGGTRDGLGESPSPVSVGVGGTAISARHGGRPAVGGGLTGPVAAPNAV